METRFTLLQINAFLVTGTSRNLQFRWTVQNIARDEETISKPALRDTFPHVKQIQNLTSSLAAYQSDAYKTWRFSIRIYHLYCDSTRSPLPRSSCPDSRRFMGRRRLYQRFFMGTPNLQHTLKPLRCTAVWSTSWMGFILFNTWMWSNKINSCKSNFNAL